MDFFEVSAKTVEDAITKACLDTGLPSDELEIQVISEGSSGFLGLGSKPAVIQVRRKDAATEAKGKSDEAEVATDVAGAATEGVKSEASDSHQEKKEHKKANKKPRKAEKEEAVTAPVETEAPGNDAELAAHREPREVPERTAEEIVTMKASASQFLEGVFKAMELPVDITMDYEEETGVLNVNFEGEDMGLLIGKRGQTLDSLQYLVSLVVNKDQKNYVRVKLDTENYRKRRKDTLENLAKNIANKVKRTQRSVSLEAMNPYERRIIHSVLQGNKAVQTYSEGNEPYRHVVVAPKREA